MVVPLPESKPATWNQLRPVSLTDHFSKVAESFVTDWAMDDIEPQIDHSQFGSRKERPTTHYLVRLVDFILKHLERFKSILVKLSTALTKTLLFQNKLKWVPGLLLFHGFVTLCLTDPNV